MVLEESNLTANLDEFFTQLNTHGNSDGLIDLDEWVSGMKALGLPLDEQRLTRAFTAIDIDSNGSLDRAELLGVLKEVRRQSQEPLYTYLPLGCTGDSGAQGTS